MFEARNRLGACITGGYFLRGARAAVTSAELTPSPQTMQFRILRSLGSKSAILWLGVNALVLAIIAYQAVTVGQPTPYSPTPQQWERIKAAQARIPKAGQPAPDFTLRAADGNEVTLASLRGKPVVLVFGSYTCPIFRGRMPALNAAHERYQDQAEFVFVYVREAHPLENGHLPENEALEPIASPTSLDERVLHAQTCATNLGIRMPVLIDDMENRTAEDYQAWPERIYLIDQQGIIAHVVLDAGTASVEPLTAKLDELLL